MPQLPLLFLLLAQGQLTDAEVRIRIGPGADRATVEASYTFTGADSARFTVIRLPGQSVIVTTLGVTEVEQPGLLRLATSAVDGSVVLRLEVSGPGRLVRVPIPVPAVATVPGTRAVRIAVTGLVGRPDRAFPRLSNPEPTDGVTRAVLANVPALLRLPPPSGWTVSRLMEWLVILLVLGATATWIARRRRPA